MGKKREDDPKPQATWLNTFADLMNLLLCFFVLLFSMSTVDAQKFELVAASFSQAFSIFSAGGSSFGDGLLISNGVSQLNELDKYINSMGEAEEEAEEESINDPINEYNSEMLNQSEEMAEKIGEALNEGDMSDSIEVDFTSQYVELTMNGALLFDSGSADLRKESLPVLEKIGLILERYSDGVIEVEGHTDNVPMHSDRYANNDELSSARALAVFYYLIDNTTLDPASIKHSGRGEYIPIADNSTPEGRALNRRVEIKIYHSL